MRTRLGLSTPPITAPHALRPYQSILHNVIQSLGDVVVFWVSCWTLAADVGCGEEVGWLPLVIATWSGVDHLLGDQLM